MEKYWPEHKVHLHILLAIFPTRLKDAELSVQKMDSYFHVGSAEKLILSLRDYSRLDYFKFTISISPEYEEHAQAHRDLLLQKDKPNFIPLEMGYADGFEGAHLKCGLPLSEKELFGMFGVLKSLSSDQLKKYLRFTLTDINTEKFHSKLAAYTAMYYQKLPQATLNTQSKSLQKAMAKQYPHHRYQPIINQFDIWGEKALSRQPFWEPILSLYFGNNIKIDDLGYREIPIKGGETSIQPYALLKITDKKLRELVKAGADDIRCRKYGTSFVTFAYNGLEFDGTVITYNNKSASLPRQQQEALRVFFEAPGKLRLRDDFLDNQEIFSRGPYPDKDNTLGKLISELHKNLRKVVVKRCIVNEPGKGWRMEI